jgi:tetratricopeptide (TPR) repeat protein
LALATGAGSANRARTSTKRHTRVWGVGCGRDLRSCATLAAQLDRPEYLVSLLYGQWAFHCIRSEYKLALSLAEQLEQIGEARNDVVALLLGHFAHGATCLWLGEFAAARAIYEQCHSMRDPAHRSIYAAITGADQYLVMLSQLAFTLTYLGYIEQGRARVNEALSAARHLGHAHSLAFVLTFVCNIEGLTGSPHELKRRAEEMIDVSNDNGFPLLSGIGMTHCGWSLTALGQAHDGHALLMKGLSVVRSTGAVIGTPSTLMAVAETYAQLGRPVEGLNCLAEAAQIIETTDERVGEARLHRLRGDLLNATGDRTAAEQSYHQALAVAERQGTKLFELFAATSLPASGLIKARPPKPVICSHQSTAGSQKGSTRRSCRTPRRCSTS